MSLITFQIVKEITVADNIFEAHFLNSSNELIIVFGLNSRFILDIRDDRQYAIPTPFATYITTDQQNNIFTCANSNIVQERVTFVRNQEG